MNPKIKNYILLFVALFVGLQMTGANPAWLESDSSEAIARRTSRDFPYGEKQFYKILKAEIPGYTEKDYQRDMAAGYIETAEIDGERRVFRKALRNIKLLKPELSGGWKGRGADASAARISYVDSVLAYCKGANKQGGAHNVVYRFSIDVPVVEEIAFDTVRVWMPFPIISRRQPRVKLLAAEPADYVMSGDRSVHNSIYFEQPSGAPGDTLHFEYTAEFVTAGEYFSPEFIMEHIQPYDTAGALYKKYTSFERPHVVRLDSLAGAIAGDEKNPFVVSEKVFDYIAANFPWAGAREYSTIGCIPRYVLDSRHGDCGQVALLYISLMRSLGIPARWESGWMLHPGEKNLHDWAEVYFEGVGWVPVDLSFGRYSSAQSSETRNFYSHGMDAHRLAANRGVCGEFYPPKKYIRSETVDAQMGEVETTRGNLFYPAWDQTLTLISATPVEISRRPLHADDAGLEIAESDEFGLVGITVATMRAEASHKAEIVSQAVMGTPVRILEQKPEWLKIQTPEGYMGWVPDSSIKLKDRNSFDMWRSSDARRVVTSLWQDRVFTTPTASGPTEVVSDIVLGSIVELDPSADLSSNQSSRVPVILPDGRRGWTSASLMPVYEWASQPFDAEKILATAYSMEGTPYLWGGASVKALDCSGLVKVSYLNNGIILRRDASQQAKTGMQLNVEDRKSFKEGDLLFFGNSSTGRVTHVGIYDSNDNYVHSSGRVKRNNLDPESVDYLYSPLSAVRIDGMEGTPGIIRAIDHPWYFNDLYNSPQK